MSDDKTKPWELSGTGFNVSQSYKITWNAGVMARDERDDARSTIEDLTDEIERGRVAIRLWRADMSDTRAVLERIACVVGVDVAALVEDASIVTHRAALESCNRARAAAEEECAELRGKLESVTVCGVEVAKVLSTTAATLGELRVAALKASDDLELIWERGVSEVLPIVHELRKHVAR